MAVSHMKAPGSTFSQEGQGQPRTMICANFIAFEYLYTKFQGYEPFDPGEDFLKFVYYIKICWPSVTINPATLEKLENTDTACSSYEVWRLLLIDRGGKVYK